MNNLLTRTYSNQTLTSCYNWTVAVGYDNTQLSQVEVNVEVLSSICDTDVIEERFNDHKDCPRLRTYSRSNLSFMVEHMHYHSWFLRNHNVLSTFHESGYPFLGDKIILLEFHI